jgi:hypothetical protein
VVFFAPFFFTTFFFTTAGCRLGLTIVTLGELPIGLTAYAASVAKLNPPNINAAAAATRLFLNMAGLLSQKKCSGNRFCSERGITSGSEPQQSSAMGSIGCRAYVPPSP